MDIPLTPELERFAGAKAGSGVDHRCHCREPLVHRQVRIVKDRSSGGEELVSAFPLRAVGLNARHLGAAALQAGDAIWPAHRFEVISAGFGGCELFGGVYFVW
jgi:hypothetical protein